MGGVIGMYNKLIFPTYPSVKPAEQYLKEDWINFSVEILFITFEITYTSETYNLKNDNPRCPLIVSYTKCVKKVDAVDVYFLSKI